MKKVYYINGNYNGNSCQDAIVVAAENFNEAEKEAEEMGVEPYMTHDVELKFELFETKEGNVTHIERRAYIAGAWYPESFFE